MLSSTLLALCLFHCLSYALDFGVHLSDSQGVKECKVVANGSKKDDVPNILQAFNECNNGGTIIFPEDQNYWIATKLHPTVHNVKISWKGKWTVRSPNYLALNTPT